MVHLFVHDIQAILVVPKRHQFQSGTLEVQVGFQVYLFLNGTQVTQVEQVVHLFQQQQVVQLLELLGQLAVLQLEFRQEQ